MTTVTDAAPAMNAAEHRTRPSMLERALDLLVRVRSTAGEGLEATMARAIDQAFAAIHRDMRS